MPHLEGHPELRAELLSACARADLYLIAIGSFSGLVVRSDLRRVAIRELASEADLGNWSLRWTALKTRAALYVFGDGLTKRGSVEAAAAVDRLQKLGAEMRPELVAQ
jgi:hypothetical protein